jgi:hypothetical protein
MPAPNAKEPLGSPDRDRIVSIGQSNDHQISFRL